MSFRLLSVLAASLLLLCCAVASSASNVVPRSITECRSNNNNSQSTSIPSFCDALVNNMTWAVTQHYAPGITAAAAVFPVPPYQNQQRQEEISNEKKSKKSPSFPHWNAASKVAIMAAGRFTYNSASAEVDTDETLWDMASVSKIMATTTAVAQLYQMGLLDLDEKISSERLLGREFASKGKGDITVRNCLLHNAGYPPDPSPLYSSPNFRGGMRGDKVCENNKRYHPVQDFGCVDSIYENLIYNQELMYPTGSRYVYSDLSMITLMYVVSKVVSKYHHLIPADRSEWPQVCAGKQTDDNINFNSHTCPFYVFVHSNIWKRYGMDSTQYIPSNTLRTPPQWYSPDLHHGQIMGFVSDENTFAMGGISGHAGVFSTTRDALKFLSIWLGGQDQERLNWTTIEMFTTVKNKSQSARALGWDTNYRGWSGYNASHGCGSMSEKTFMHRGFTGTQLCADPTTGLVTAILGNGRWDKKNVDGLGQIYHVMFDSLANDLMVRSP